MRIIVPIQFTVLALLLCALPVFGQQSTTDTNCNVNGQQVNCTSNTTTTGSTDAQRAEQQREMNEAGKAAGAALGSAIGNKILKKRVNKWCEGHPGGSWNFSNGQNVSCFNWNEAHQPAANAQFKAQRNEQATTIAVAAWTFCKAHPDQSWTGPITGKVTPCGELVALDDAQCSRNPGLDACKAIADTKTPASAPGITSDAAPSTAQPAPVSAAPAALVAASARPASVTPAPTPAPLTPEQKDAISYCKRNPTATITWNNGTVSPCSSVLGPQ